MEFEDAIYVDLDQIVNDLDRRAPSYGVDVDADDAAAAQD